MWLDVNVAVDDNKDHGNDDVGNNSISDESMILNFLTRLFQ